MSSTPCELVGRTALAIAATLIVVALLAAIGFTGYRLVQGSRQAELAISMTGGDPSAGPRLMRKFGCAGCHSINGVSGANGNVGPRLDDLRGRVFISGGLANTPDNLIRWITNPQSVAPHTAMPSTGISEAEARNIAAFLYSR
jgi:cytochrome c